MRQYLVILQHRYKRGKNNMELKEIRKLLQEEEYAGLPAGRQVVLVEEGQPPLVIRELRSEEEPPQDVPIASRWPKAQSIRSVLEGRSGQPVRADARPGGDQILERLNKEILALKEQISQDETAVDSNQ